MFEQSFKSIDDVLRKEAGCTTELDYTEQTSWLLFLKYLDGLEQDRADTAKVEGKKYSYILDKPYRWEGWAAPKGKEGKVDHNKALTGDDLRDFVNQKLFPYLHGFKQKASGPNTIEYKIGEIFGEIKNKVQSGYNTREIIDHIDALRFRSQAEKHELSHLYEAKIRNMGNAGRNSGEYYTPRPLIRAIVQVVQPKIASARTGREGLRRRAARRDVEDHRRGKERPVRRPGPRRLRPSATHPRGTREQGQGPDQHSFQQQAASLSRLRAVALRQRRRGRARPGQAHSLATVEVSQLHRRCPGRSG